MKALEITQPGEIRLVDREMPQTGDDDILLRIRYVGFCGSDLSTFLGKNPMVQYPRVPGHEISAVIEATGVNVPASYKPGQTVTVVPYTHCGYCSSCRQNRFNACRYNQTMGVQRDGAMTEYIAVPWQKVITGETISETGLAIVEPLTVGFHAIGNARVTDQDTVLVMGCGMIGSGAIIRASLRGATVIAVDIDDSKLITAGKLGAHFTINSGRQSLHSELELITGGHGPAVAVEAAGNPATYRTIFEEVAFAGRVVCIGYSGSDVTLPTRLWVQKELEISGSRNAGPSDFEAVIRYLKTGRLDENLLVTEKVKPEEAPEAMKRWAEAPGRILKIMVEF